MTTCIVSIDTEPSAAKKSQEKGGKAKKQTKYRAHFDQAFDNAIIANPVKRRINAPANVEAPEVIAVNVEHVRVEFFRVCDEESYDAKRVAFKRELRNLFKEYPQEEDADAAGTRWIWKAQP